ncbi:MAG: type IIA DNA topoisomerase subunit B [Saprospiraceae bacterium]|nr:type IIA DNA topoisomerase subunit B [Saprospiraceae bacterium]MBK8485272.1 type IIA DNA topoisomerase subunit B [Saprospiraceae bacterium]MBK9222487.1 type IIA DNA topoisomerase subunit B [Saprospiraceae bacterium]MBK9720478.1 type IIA DNA topoisomerase subunit B [Saprospiraceae bacterium]MBK9727449.1 type IIA DNA topoisomerase subunit B [Saprospiraceae bacterium]
MAQAHNYTEENIRSLDWKEHIRLRPGMYIGKLGDGTSIDDGIYILLKEVIDNCIDEYVMGYGREVDIDIKDGIVTVRDYGRGIPLGKVIECVSQINTGGKYDSKAFKKSVGLNGVGTKAVNALSYYFKVQAIRDGKTKIAEFERGTLIKDYNLKNTDEVNGTIISFRPDDKIFQKHRFVQEFVESRIWNYAYLNAGLRIHYNGKTYVSKHGLKDMLERRTDGETLNYPIIHIKGEDIECVFTHGAQYGEQYYSFVNGQYTSQGGTHLNYFREAIVKTIRDFYKKDFDSKDIHAGAIGALSVRIEEPVFESQTKTKLGSTTIAPEGSSLRTFISDFICKEFDLYLHQNPEAAKELLSKILQSERERKEIAGIKKLANQRAKKANLHNKKLRDCKYHLTDTKVKPEILERTTLFITEGDSASGSITKSRNPELQAVFSLRGKPLNCFGMSKKVVYENEELNLLQHALDIEDGIANLRYSKVVIATDADVDGMHIRLLLLTFFLQFFPELVRGGHLFILDTPLFRVRDKKQTFYCYSEKEKQQAINTLRGKAEITRFKGLGEISPDEFAAFIGEDIRLEPVIINEDSHIEKILEYYMGKNTGDRQEFIIENLRTDLDQLVPKELEILEEDLN